MTSIQWVALCEGIVKDDYRRMSLIGIANDLPVPSLPLVLEEHMIVARVSRTGRSEELGVSFGVVTPAGLWVTPVDDAVEVTVSGDFVVIRIRSLPLRDEGVHRFEVGLSNGSAAAVEVPVWLCAHSPEDMHVH